MFKVTGFGKSGIYQTKTAGAAMHKFRKEFQKELQEKGIHVAGGRDLKVEFINANT